MSDVKTNAGQGLGIAGFVLGLIALIISFIPCLGMYALVPGIIAIILSAIGFSQASKGNGAKGLIIAALVVSILGTIIAGWQYYALSHVANNYVDALENFDDEFKNAMEDIEEDGTLDASTLVSGESDIDKYIEEEDYDKLLDVYEKTLDKYVDNIEAMENGSIENLGEGMAAATKITLVTVKIATVIPKFNEEQLERFNKIDEKYKETQK